MEESEAAGGGSFYDQVYHAERPELFFKATPWRVRGDGDVVRIRQDARGVFRSRSWRSSSTTAPGSSATPSATT